MEDKFSDELISAYIDGELTSSQRAEVEAALRSDDKLRRMFESLRAQRENVKSLPDFEIEGDFARRVLHQAERTMLSESREDSVDHQSGQTANHPSSPLSSLKPNAGLWRKLIWGGAAIAAGLLIMFLYPRDDREVTLHTSAGSLDMAESLEENADASSPAGEGIDDLPSLQSAEAKTAHEAEQDLDGAIPSRPHRKSLSTAKTPKPASESFRSSGGGGLSAREDSSSKSPQKKPNLFSDKAAAELVVVRVKVSASALRSKTFEKTLQRNQIFFSDIDQIAGLQKKALGAKDALGLGDNLLDRRSKVRKKEKEVKGGEQNRDNNARKLLPAKNAKVDQIEMVYVEASVQQINAALSDLKKMAVLTSSLQSGNYSNSRLGKAFAAPSAATPARSDSKPKSDNKPNAAKPSPSQDNAKIKERAAGQAWRISSAELPNSDKYFAIEEKTEKSREKNSGQRLLKGLETELRSYFSRAEKQETDNKKTSKSKLEDESKNKEKTKDSFALRKQDLSRDRPEKLSSSPTVRVLFILDIIADEPAEKQKTDSGKK